MASSGGVIVPIISTFDSKGFSQSESALNKFSKVAIGAFVAAAGAAAHYALQIGTEMVQAAIEDAAAQQKLAVTLKNVTKATDNQIAAVETYITTTSKALGVADDQLRPAFDRLVRATKDVTTSQELLNLALDISAGTGKSLDTVVQALGKAYEGSTTSLSKLGTGIDKASISSMTFDQITQELSKTFAGQAQSSADTYAGKLARMQISLDELKEGFGNILLTKLQPLIDWMLGEGIQGLEAFANALAGNETDSLTAQNRKFNDAMGFTKDEVMPPFVQAMTDLGDAVRDLAKVWADSLGKMETDGDSSITKIVRLLTKLMKATEKAVDMFNTLQDVLAFIPGYTPGEIPGWGGERAMGGPVGRGSTYLVGEQGPELFSPNRNGTIIPNDKLMASGGAGGNVIINVSGALDPEAVARQIKQIMQTSAARTGNYTNFGIAPLAVG